MFDPAQASKFSGKITARDNPIYIADAAVYLEATQPDLGITDPYELDEDQFNAAVDLLKQQNKFVGEYWPDATKNISSHTNGDSVIGSSWRTRPVPCRPPARTSMRTCRRKVRPAGRTPGCWSSQAEHPNYYLEWMNWMGSPKVQAQVAEWFGEAPANLGACDLTSDPKHCDTYHAKDEKYYDQIGVLKTPISDCGDDRGSE